MLKIQCKCFKFKNVKLLTTVSETSFYLLKIWFNNSYLLLNYFSLCLLAALQALKRKKRYEKQLQQIDGTLSTIEFQREALENASTNTEVLNVMGSAAKALQAAHQNM